MQQKTLIITSKDVQKVLDMTAAIDAVEDVFKLYGAGHTQMPAKTYLEFPDGDLRCMPSYASELGFACVKNVSVHPGNRDFPTVMATLTLFDPDSGFPLAIMDGTLITQLRTAAAAAVATKYLARNNSETLGFIGAGKQTQSQFQALLTVLPAIKQVLLYDLNPSRAALLAEQWSSCYPLDFSVPESVASLVGQSDVLTTTTPSRTPIVFRDHIKNGLHINAIGADAKGKQELESELLKHAVVVVDNWEQTSHSGEINMAVAEGAFHRKDIQGDIGELVTGKIPGRTRDDQITIFDSTGLAVQDLACAVKVYLAYQHNPPLQKQLAHITF